MRKGQRTRDEILRTALHQASTIGLEGLSIGTLARDVGMSKSGLFAHFGSKEELQKAVLEYAREYFVHKVVRPAIAQPRGEPRLRALFQGWLGWMDQSELPGGCPFISAAMEYDDRPGPVRDLVAATLVELEQTFARSIRICMEEGQFRSDVEPEQVAYEVYALLFAYHMQARLLDRLDARDRAMLAFERTLARCRVEA